MHASGITNAKNAKPYFGLKRVTAACFARMELCPARPFNLREKVVVAE
jgi:hypothetical protein